MWKFQLLYIFMLSLYCIQLYPINSLRSFILHSKSLSSFEYTVDTSKQNIEISRIRTSTHYPLRTTSLTRLYQLPQNEDIEVGGELSKSQKKWFPGNDIDERIPSPLKNIVDVNIKRKAVVYEIELSRDLGFEVAQGSDFAYVDKLDPSSVAAKLGVLNGDIIAATSATAGGQMWGHESADSVNSALSTRFVMTSTVKMQLERRLDQISKDLVPLLKVPYYSTVRLKRPIGLHVLEGPNRKVFVQSVKPNLGAARSRRVEVGDQIVAMSASWGDRLWDILSVESLVVGVRMRTDSHLTFRLMRLVPVSLYMGPNASLKPQSSIMPFQQLTANNPVPVSGSRGGNSTSVPVVWRDQPTMTLMEIINSLTTAADLKEFWKFILDNNGPEVSAVGSVSKPPVSKSRVSLSVEAGNYQWTTYTANRFMTTALRLEQPNIAIELFELAFGFVPRDPNPARSALQLFQEEEGEQADITWAKISKSTPPRASSPILGKSMNRFLVPNNYVCTTAIKAYGRRNEVEKAMAILPWMEATIAAAEQRNYQELERMNGTLTSREGSFSAGEESSRSDMNKIPQVADIYLLSALLYVCAKAKRVKAAEDIFWKEIPRRNLAYTVATANSLMFMYAKINKPDDALRVYELVKSLGLKCTVVTYGVLIKALMRSGQKSLQDTAFEILRTLPRLGISPGVEVYNQILEHYASTHNYRQTKAVLKLMAQAKPKVKPDAVSYGYIISCFSDSKKPRSALSAFQLMRRQNIAPSSFTYMGVLKALAHMRDGVSAVQVIREMFEVGIRPDKKHFATAMFACIIANQSSLAESLIDLYIRDGGRPDTVLGTLWLRALLQQDKWDKGLELLEKMEKSANFEKPNQYTFNYLLQYQVAAGKFSEATETLRTILSGYSAQLKKMGSIGSMLPTFNSLSFALGMYSAQVIKLQREDLGALQQQLEPISSDFFTRALPDKEMIEPSSSTEEDSAEDSIEDSFEDSLDLGGVDSLLEKIENTPISPFRVESSLSKPTEEAFEFLISSLKLVSEFDNIYTSSEFYVEVIKALILESKFEFADEILNLRAENKIKLKNENDPTLKKFENLTAKAIKGKITKK